MYFSQPQAIFIAEGAEDTQRPQKKHQLGFAVLSDLCEILRVLCG